MSPMLISIVVFVCVTGMVAAIAFAFADTGTKKAEDRLKALKSGKAGAGDGSTRLLKEETFREGMEGLQGVMNSLALRFGNMNLFFIQADSPLSANMFYALSVAAGLLAATASFLSRSPTPFHPLAFIAGSSLPMIWLTMRRKARFAKFAKQLPDALELVARALRSGHSLAAGMHVVVQEVPAPISTEFGIVFESQNLGIPIEQALKEMTRRMPNMDLKFFVTSVAIQRQTGGDLAEILDKIGHIVRERFKILGQVQALTGEGRISGVVLMGLPIALFFAVYYLNRDYVMLLFTDPLGKQMIAVAIVLQILGAYCIKKIVDIKV